MVNNSSLEMSTEGACGSLALLRWKDPKVCSMGSEETDMDAEASSEVDEGMVVEDEIGKVEMFQE